MKVLMRRYSLLHCSCMLIRLLVFDIYDSSIANNTNIQLFTKNNTTNQKFRFVESGEEGVYYIESALGTCVDLTDASVANNSNIASYLVIRVGLRNGNLLKHNFLAKKVDKCQLFSYNDIGSEN